ncbi:MAG: hypothetical protein ACE5JJ_03805 [Nitrospinota bacterium]
MVTDSSEPSRGRKSSTPRGRRGEKKSLALRDKTGQRQKASEKKRRELQLTPLEKARLQGYFERGALRGKKKLISSFGEPLKEPLIIQFDAEDAADGLYTLMTTGVTLGVSSTVSVATSTAQIDALKKEGINFRVFDLPD